MITLYNLIVLEKVVVNIHYLSNLKFVLDCMYLKL